MFYKEGQNSDKIIGVGYMDYHQPLYHGAVFALYKEGLEIAIVRRPKTSKPFNYNFYQDCSGYREFKIYASLKEGQILLELAAQAEFKALEVALREDSAPTLPKDSANNSRYLDYQKYAESTDWLPDQKKMADAAFWVAEARNWRSSGREVSLKTSFRSILKDNLSFLNLSKNSSICENYARKLRSGLPPFNTQPFAFLLEPAVKRIITL